MEIRTQVEGAKARLTVAGWLDTQNSPELGAAIDALGEGVEELELDFAELEYISSAGLRQIVAARKKMKGKLALSNVSPGIWEVLEMTGVSKRVTVL